MWKKNINTGARESLNMREFQGSGLSGNFCTKSVRHMLASLYIRGGFVSKVKINLFQPPNVKLSSTEKEDYWLLEEKEGKICNKSLKAQQLFAKGNLQISGKILSLGSEQLTWV